MYKYIRIGRIGARYLSPQQSISFLFWLLYLKRDTLRDRRWPSLSTFFREKPVKWSRILLKRWRNDFSVLFSFALYKLDIQKPLSEITLPCSGQMCIPVHQGFKIFDFKEGRVFKTFNKDTDASIVLEEIDLLRQVSDIPFAPSLRSWSVEGKWYEEDYVDGSYENLTEVLGSEEILLKFRNHLVPHLKYLMLLREPQPRNIVAYGQELVSTVDLTPLENGRASEAEFESVKGFILSLSKALQKRSDDNVLLLLTHGDFCPANMLSTNDGIRVVDWEGFMPRSVLFDFYSYFFHRSAVRRVPVFEVAGEIGEGLLVIVAELENEAPDVSASFLNFGQSYRFIFYLEYVCRLLERAASDAELDVSRYLLGYISIFKEYEATVK